MTRIINGKEYPDNLSGAYLRYAYIRDSYLCGADLRSADLRDVDLRDVDLRHAKLRGALGLEQTYVAGEGNLIVYKKLRGGVICKLLIPKEAKRSNATGRKCRAEYAVVLEGEGVSKHDNSFKYRVGETVRPRGPFDENRWEECGSGIHFFITRDEAERY